MHDEKITVCHVPSGEKFRFVAAKVPDCDCGLKQEPGNTLVQSAHPGAQACFEYAEKTYRITCPFCRKELLACEALKNDA